jgi:hypothetical protein
MGSEQAGAHRPTHGFHALLTAGGAPGPAESGHFFFVHHDTVSVAVEKRFPPVGGPLRYILPNAWEDGQLTLSRTALHLL